MEYTTITLGCGNMLDYRVLYYCYPYNKGARKKKGPKTNLIDTLFIGESLFVRILV